MKCVLKILFWCFLWCYGVFASNYTFDWSMEKLCKVHISEHGYRYENFYEVIGGVHTNDDYTFEMHLAILAASNGHILLSDRPSPGPNDAVYEIVVGGGANTFTELRRNLRRNSKQSAKTIGILSAIQYRPFYIKTSHDGVIEFGKEGEILPLITYSDVDPIAVKYFSFASWSGVEAKFLYDCPRPGDKSNLLPISTPVVKKLSSSEELKQTLLLDKDPFLPPQSTVNMLVNVKATNIKYNTYDAKLTVGISMEVEWTDDSMAWNPDKFNGTQILKFRQGQIWTPTFFAFNSDDREMLDSKNPELITMTSAGQAIYHFHTMVDTWCHDDDYTIEKKRWPNDEFDCTILIGAWQPHERFSLSPLSTTFEQLDETLETEWQTVQYYAVVPIEVWRTYIQPKDNETNQSDRILLNLMLKRRATTYNIVFYTPLIVLVVFVLLSFWHESLQMSRVWFYSGCSVAVCAGLCYVNDLVPTHSVPNILVLYTTVLIGILVALLTQVLLMTSVVERLCKTSAVHSVMTTSRFRMTFCLPAMKNCNIYESINEGYASPEDDDSGVIVAPRNGTVEEMQTEDPKYGEKEELAEVIDKLMFFIYSLTFVIMLALYY